MIKNFNMKPTGWFQVAWSAEIEPGAVKPMKYFGQELVAARKSTGELTIFDAYCPHMGVHLGHGGKMIGDQLTCPYHGWRFDMEGANTLIPYEENGHTINKKLKMWHIVEQHEMVFLWHDPAGGEPRKGWLPHLFNCEDNPADINDFYPSHTNGATVFKPGEKFHPQMVVENAADSAHFKHTHGAPEEPVILSFDASSPIWKSSMGFLSPKTKEVALTTYARNPGVGLSFFQFEHHGSSTAKKSYNGFNRRLVLSATPVDDETTDLRVTYFFPKDPASPDIMPLHVKEAAAHTERLFEEDAMMWRHQKFIQRPLFSSKDQKIYTALRKWSNEFYELEGAPAGPTPTSER